MVDNIQLTKDQKLQQQKINAYIKSLEDKLAAPNTGAIDLDDENVGDILENLFIPGFDIGNDTNGQNLMTGEVQNIVNYLKDMNSNLNISNMFDANGNLVTDNVVDLNNDGQVGTADDVAVLTNILGSKPAMTYENSRVRAGKGSEITLDNGQKIRHGLNQDSVVFKTKGGYHIVTDTNRGGHQTKIFDSNGKMITYVAGDPHVNEGDSTDVNGWDWHFGDDSTFILDDGTEILFNTVGNVHTNIYVTAGLYIISDDDVYQTGLDISDQGPRNADITKLDVSAVEWDAMHADAKAEDDGADTFVYSKEANDGRGGWAVLTDEGTFEDIAYESWGQYTQGKHDGVSQTFDGQTVDTSVVDEAGNVITNSRVHDSINLEQKEAALDGEAVRVFDKLEQAGITDAQKEIFFDKYFSPNGQENFVNSVNQILERSTEAALIFMDVIKEAPDFDNAVNDAQLDYLVMFADFSMDVAEKYVDVINQGDQNKINQFENWAQTYMEYSAIPDKSNIVDSNAISLLEEENFVASANLMQTFINLQESSIKNDAINVFEKAILENNIFESPLEIDDFTFVETVALTGFGSKTREEMLNNLVGILHKDETRDFINGVAADLNEPGRTEGFSETEKQDFYTNGVKLLTFANEMFEDPNTAIHDIKSVNKDGSKISQLLENSYAMEGSLIEVLNKQNEKLAELGVVDHSQIAVNNHIIEQAQVQMEITQRTELLKAGSEQINALVDYLGRLDHSEFKKIGRDLSADFNLLIAGNINRDMAGHLQESLLGMVEIGEKLMNGEFTNTDETINAVALNDEILDVLIAENMGLSNDDKFNANDREYFAEQAQRLEDLKGLTELDADMNDIQAVDLDFNKAKEQLELYANEYANQPQSAKVFRDVLNILTNLEHDNVNRDYMGPTDELAVKIYDMFENDESGIHNKVVQAKINYLQGLINTMNPDNTRERRDISYYQSQIDGLQELL